MPKNQKKSKKEKLLNFIESNAKKNEFINWLNTQNDVAFTSEQSWDDIKKELSDLDEISAQKLRMFGASLSSEEDVEKLLEDVEQKTKEAEKVAKKLSYLSSFKKFSISIGGAIILEGLIFITVGVVLVFNLTDLVQFQNDLGLYIGIISSLFGLINLLGGLLLATK